MSQAVFIAVTHFWSKMLCSRCRDGEREYAGLHVLGSYTTLSSLCWYMDNRHMWWAYFLILPNIFVDAPCCCCRRRHYCYFENGQSLPGIFCTESHWLKSLAVQPKRLARHWSCVPVVRVCISASCEHKGKEQYLVSFYKLPTLKGRAQTSLWPKKSEPGGPFALCGLRVLRTMLQMGAPGRVLMEGLEPCFPGGMARELGGRSPGPWLHPADPGISTNASLPGPPGSSKVRELFHVAKVPAYFFLSPSLPPLSRIFKPYIINMHKCKDILFTPNLASE